MIHKSILIYIYISAGMVLSGCTKIEDPVTRINTDEQSVILRLMMPQNNRLSTYAIDAVDQNTIYTLDVLAFQVTDEGKEIYAYRKNGVLLRPNPGATEVNFYANLLKSEDNYRFVLIANAATALQNALSGLPANAEKETLMSRITHTITNRWDASSAANFTPLPMWGESSVIHGISNSTQGFNVSMLRSLAAIDVAVSAEDFVLTGVRVYNHPDKGRIAPLAAHYDAGNSKVTATSIPAGAGLLTQPDFYNPNSENAVRNEIFLFERDAPANTGEPTATALLIKGKYGDSDTETYYRIDLTDEDGKLMPILRNHRYSIDIITVHGSGFTNETQAWNSRPVGMTATVTQWDEATIADTNVPIQSYLKVNIENITVTGLANQFVLEVSTNAPIQTLANLPDWLSITEQSTSGDKTSYTMKVAQNMTSEERTSKINVQVANLTRIVNLRQYKGFINLGSDFGFYVYPNDLPVLPSPNNPVWFYRANVEYEYYSPLDAFQTQKSGNPYPESCAALGPGYRLPTITELEQLIPGDNDKRASINSTIMQNGGDFGLSR